MMLKQTTFWQGLFCYALTRNMVGAAKDAPPTTTGAVTKASPISATTLPALAGVNLAGLDFGATNDGQYKPNSVLPPSSQIDHYIKQGVNLFRLPVAWEYLQPDMNAELNKTSLGIYKELVKNVTSRNAYALIDIHAYARFKGQIVGQSTDTPANTLVSLWTQLAQAFQDDPMVLFGLMNEPHDVVIETWAKTLQMVVTAVRATGATNVMTIPGTDYTALKTFSEWYKVMKTVHNGDGTFDGLVIEVHRYLDQDNSGTSTECVANVADEVKSAAQMLKADGRQAILAEIGGGNTQTCEDLLPKTIEAISSNFPEWIGFAFWSAGAFNKDYELVIVVQDTTSPTGWKDQPNWLSIRKFLPKANAQAPKTIKKGGGATPQTVNPGGKGTSNTTTGSTTTNTNTDTGKGNTGTGTASKNNDNDTGNTATDPDKTKTDTGTGNTGTGNTGTGPTNSNTGTGNGNTGTGTGNTGTGTGAGTGAGGGSKKGGACKRKRIRV